MWGGGWMGWQKIVQTGRLLTRISPAGVFGAANCRTCQWNWAQRDAFAPGKDPKLLPDGRASEKLSGNKRFEGLEGRWGRGGKRWRRGCWCGRCSVRCLSCLFEVSVYFQSGDQGSGLSGPAALASTELVFILPLDTLGRESVCVCGGGGGGVRGGRHFPVHTHSHTHTHTQNTRARTHTHVHASRPLPPPPPFHTQISSFKTEIKIHADRRETTSTDSHIRAQTRMHARTRTHMHARTPPH